MDKILTFQSTNDRGVFLYTVGEGRDKGYLEKNASVQFHPEIAKFISSAQKIPGKTQLLLTALGAGEYYGENQNGDFFPIEALKNETAQYGYKTFEHFAHCYKHHVNKDPAKSYGKVTLSVWNDQMKRVELIVVIDDDKAPDIVERIDKGEVIETSMGCKVPFDVCSICGNKAKTRAQYCDHLRYHMKRIPPGHTKKAYAINTFPRFFDISFVLIGADRISAVMKKVAHSSAGVSSALLAEKHMEKLAFGLTKEKTAARKLAEMEKEVPGNIKPETVQKIENKIHEDSELLRSLEPDIPKRVIIQISSNRPSGMGSLNKILSTIAMMGIVPKKHEFQDIALRALGKPHLAEEYSRRGVVFPSGDILSPAQRCACQKYTDIGAHNFDPLMFENLKPLMEDRSYYKPLLHKRIVKLVKLAGEDKLTYPNVEHVKTAEEDGRNPAGVLPVMLTLGGIYAALGEKLPAASEKGIDKILKNHPALALAAGIGAVASFNALTQRNVMGKYDFDPDKGPIHDPNQSWQSRIREKNTSPLMKTGASVGKRLIFGVPAAYMASGVQEVKKARNPHEKESLIGKAIRQNPDIFGIALVGEAMAGGPLTKKIKSLFQPLRKFAGNEGLSQLRKTAGFVEDLRDTAVFSLGFPGSSLAVRATGNLIDQGIISGVGKLLAKKKEKQLTGGYNAQYR